LIARIGEVSTRTVILSKLLRLGETGLSLFKEYSTGTDKSNVILILAEDMGIGDVSLVNEGQTNMPNLDEPIKKGLLFNQGLKTN